MLSELRFLKERESQSEELKLAMENKIIEVSEIVDSLKSALGQVEAENKQLSDRSLDLEACIERQRAVLGQLQEENTQLKLRELDRLRQRKGPESNLLLAIDDPLDRVNLADYHRLEQDYKSLVEENDKLRQLSLSCNRDVRSLERHVASSEQNKELRARNSARPSVGSRRTSIQPNQPDSILTGQSLETEAAAPDLLCLLVVQARLLESHIYAQGQSLNTTVYLQQAP